VSCDLAILSWEAATVCEPLGAAVAVVDFSIPHVDGAVGSGWHRDIAELACCHDVFALATLFNVWGVAMEALPMRDVVVRFVRELRIPHQRSGPVHAAVLIRKCEEGALVAS